MLPHPDDPQQAPRPPGPAQVCICPSCGHRHGGYDQAASALLDCLSVAADALREARRLLEAEVLP